jgi:hypothetical protein
MSSALASLAVVIYTIDDTAAAAAVGAKGKDKVKEDKDKFNNAVSKSILLSCF